MKFAELKKFFIFDLIGALIIAALVAVVTVLFGNFGEVTWRVFFTLLMVVVHSLVSLSFVWDESEKNGLYKLPFFLNTVFIIIILSFITSVFGIWKIVSAETIWHLYQTYFYIGFGSLHADILSKAMRKEKYMDSIIYANFGFIIGVVLLLQPIIYVADSMRVLPELYFRLLAAVAIIDGTLSILTIIFYRLYVHKHPELQKDSVAHKGLGIWVWILGAFLAYEIFSILLRMILMRGFW